MTTSEPFGRNEPCPCGSGQKYKHCCEGRQDIVEEARRSPWLIGGVGVVGIGVVATIAMQLGDPKPSEVNPSLSRPMTSQSPIVDPASLIAPLGGSPAPAGTAPPGKVWSAEHGHYHDIAGAGAPPLTVSPNEMSAIAPPAAAAGTIVPQPDGPAPEGKVWSPEHGHYHDIAGAAPAPNTISPGDLTQVPPPGGTPGALTPEPEGPAPEGKVWSAEHGHYHDAPGATPAVKIGGEAGGELVPIPPPVGTGPAPSPTPPPKPADPPGTPPK